MRTAAQSALPQIRWPRADRDSTCRCSSAWQQACSPHAALLRACEGIEGIKINLHMPIEARGEKLFEEAVLCDAVLCVTELCFNSLRAWICTGSHGTSIYIYIYISVAILAQVQQLVQTLSPHMGQYGIIFVLKRSTFENMCVPEHNSCYGVFC